MLSATARDAFPSPLKTDAEVVAGRLTNTRGLEPQGRFTVTVDGEAVFVPTRVYLDEFQCRSLCSTTQLAILDCLQTRHHNGFVRERALRRIIDLNTPWSAPFVVQLMSEYVIEILDVIDAGWERVDGPLLVRFLAENPRYHALVRRRVISYWNVYYRRRFPRR